MHTNLTLQETFKESYKIVFLLQGNFPILRHWSSLRDTIDNRLALLTGNNLNMALRPMKQPPCSLLYPGNGTLTFLRYCENKAINSIVLKNINTKIFNSMFVVY